MAVMFLYPPVIWGIEIVAGAWLIIESNIGGERYEKKIRSMILVMAIVFFSAFQVVRASADLIFEPSGDSFYDAHRMECQTLRRSCIANGPNGELVVYKSPEDPEIVTRIPNASAIKETMYFFIGKKDKGL